MCVCVIVAVKYMYILPILNQLSVVHASFGSGLSRTRYPVVTKYGVTLKPFNLLPSVSISLLSRSLVSLGTTYDLFVCDS